MFSKFSFSKALLISLSFFISHAANAELTTVSVLITEGKTDCSGNNAYFDDPNPVYSDFSACRITMEDGNGDTYSLSDVIIKFDSDGQSSEISNQYIDPEQKVFASDFNFTFYNDPKNSGSWEYNDGDFKYPDIRFWTAKAGDDFLLFWQVDLSEAPESCLEGTHDSNLSYNCMNLAQSVTTGTWTTPDNKELSHITFFGGLCEETDANDGPNCGTTTTVPEPTSIALFALALLGIAARRKKYTL